MGSSVKPALVEETGPGGGVWRGEVARTEGPSDSGALTHPTIPVPQSSGEGALPWSPTSYSLRATEHLTGTAAAEKLLFVHHRHPSPQWAVRE